MIEQLDKELFLFLNSFHSPFWDSVMRILTDKEVWIPMYLIILWYLFRRTRRLVLVIFLFLVTSIVVSDQLSNILFKDMFQRLRPCHEPTLTGLVHIVREKCGGLYGFVSSHASNSFNFAIFSLLIIRRRGYTIFILTWAVMIGYTRVYLGVHYPGDVIVGAAFGALIGYLFYRIFLYTLNNLLIQIPWFTMAEPGKNNQKSDALH
jgi:undecaprenyl-diphosphatase